MTPPDRPERAPRRIVLVDLDWQEADFLPALLRTPGVGVGLVTGANADDAGVRVAALCGLQGSVELADLAREIFDLALLGDRSPRREKVDRLLRALGTPVTSPAEFMRGAAEDAAPPPRAAATVPADPLPEAPVAPATPGVVDAAAFSRRLAAAAAHRRAGGPPFVLARLAYEGPEAVVEAALARVLDALPAAAGGECACRTGPGELLLLCAGGDGALARARAGLEQRWRDAWPHAGGRGAAPPPVEERLELDVDATTMATSGP